MSLVNRLYLDPTTGNGQGNFTSMLMKLDFLFEKNPDHKPEDQNSPSHRVLIRGVNGAVEAGAAWPKTVQEGRNRGARFYSFTVDDPSFDAPLNLTAFMDTTTKSEKDQPRAFDVVWRRQRARDVA